MYWCVFESDCMYVIEGRLDVFEGELKCVSEVEKKVCVESVGWLEWMLWETEATLSAWVMVVEEWLSVSVMVLMMVIESVYEVLSVEKE